MRKVSRVTLAAAVASLLAIGLTACDPPMPPDVLAQIEEQTYTCVAGDVTISAPESIADPVQQWQSSVATNCTSPTMTLTTGTSNTDLAIGFKAPAGQQVFASVPLAIESGTIIFNLSVTSSLNLTPATAAKVLNGQITRWNDPEIVKENVGTEMPNEPIVLRPRADQAAFDSLNAWFTRLGSSIEQSGLQRVTDATADEYANLAEGEVAVVPGSIATIQGASTVSVLLGEDQDKNPILATPAIDGTSSAATQWVAKASGSSVTVTLDPGRNPVPQAGFDTAATPYQAIYPLNLYLTGKDTLLKRAMAVFLLRLDSQGVLAVSNFNQLDEPTRDLALATVRKGLPVHKPKKD